MKTPVFYTDNNQPVDMMGLVQRHSGGLFISHRRAPLIAHEKRFPNLPRLRHYRSLMGLSRGRRQLKQASVIVLGTLGSSWKEIKDFPVKKATLFHGTYRMLAPKMVAEHRHFNHLFLNGPRQERMLKHALAQLDDDIQFDWSVNGYIPFDEFPARDAKRKTEFLQQLGLSPDLPVVTYLPARRQRGSFLNYALPIAQQASGVNVIIRPHPNQLKMDCNDESAYLQELKQCIEERPNCHLDGTAGYYQLTIPEMLSVSDLLISDATSPTEEAMFYDIPQIICERYPRDKYMAEYHDFGMADDDINGLMRLYDCGLHFENSQFDHWGKAIDYSLNHPQQHRQARQDYFHDAFGEVDQQAAKRVANILQQL